MHVHARAFCWPWNVECQGCRLLLQTIKLTSVLEPRWPLFIQLLWLASYVLANLDWLFDSDRVQFVKKRNAKGRVLTDTHIFKGILQLNISDMQWSKYVFPTKNSNEIILPTCSIALTCLCCHLDNTKPTCLHEVSASEITETKVISGSLIHFHSHNVPLKCLYPYRILYGFNESTLSFHPVCVFTATSI